MPAPLTAAAIDALRALTPGAQGTTHFNHGGASLPSAATLEAIYSHLQREATLGPMEAGVAAREQTDARAPSPRNCSTPSRRRSR